MAENGIGASLKRKEDNRFLTGKGNYTSDINRPGQTHAYIVRSPHAHATINSVDISAAKSAPGVVAVFVGQDLLDDAVGGLVCGASVTGKGGEVNKAPPRNVLTMDKARFVGDPIAVVIAETLAQAKDGAELVAIDYSELPSTVSTATSDADGAPQLHEECPNNVALDWELGDQAAVDAAFAAAHKTAEVELVNNRMVTNAMEPRAAVGEYNSGTDETTLYVTSQNPHVHRLVMSAFMNIAPEHKFRVVAPDVGGGFGSKIFTYNEEAICAWAAKRVNRPVKWTSDRSEGFMSDAHGRDHVTKAEMAMDADGKFTGMRVSSKGNMGAYLQLFSVSIPTLFHGFLLAGQYTTPAIYLEMRCVMTNTAPVDAARGAGRPEATYLLERLVDVSAAEMGLDPAEIRRRNFINADQMPYQTPVVQCYDSGDYHASLDKALANADYDSFAARQTEAKGRGKLRGIGLSSYIEACGVAPSAAVGSLGVGVGLWESAQVRFNPTGGVTVFTGTHSHGQGHETAFAQLVTERLGVPVEQVEVVHGDTDKGQFGMGTYGSRSLPVGGVAIANACDKIIAKGKKIAAHTLEASEDDIEFGDGNFTVAGTDKTMNIAEVAFTAYVPHNYPEGVEPGLDEIAFFDPLNFSFPAGAHVCEVEIDPDTGTLEIVKYTAVDDFGVLVNPMIVEGQVHGGLAHGIGQALLEGCVYDDDTGQLVTGSFQDYCMPRADNLPSFDVDYAPTVPLHNPLGVKGCGEAGAIAAPPAVINAIVNALGIKHLDMPATPEKVWRAAQAAG
ncbi:MAG: xanthine dehydrogenase family protein molybdopterin-binding subunit [Rhodospirillaceae bacterium]|jgi:aerobic carbon-monoxide dehydrogenase large subunit|nr:xanthine dehydrogenase family protein molybdopterin-binding subunit [Rhodospirillaceae bacterium]MBT3493552.1 xanthine dehydrogenase family protein molybdopterin-binding subunit [Rhodospirillaceae bacterium]MBT3976891.1 xanthine dehydrogenase family protein molybdopterin-binding subunit [Rhodospirillaceae bacterium]MBT4168232.1 xanthine dehydrogenase family protein molybdopterin-binding subunit [Rhodospirillaceae bacterium]MBT4565284.1 xanthine dehydrogenase family protein molybdopterin-bind